jgi:MAP/microtubule affinity-regulating kinase
LDGLSYCHSKGIIHRDIKLDNILLNYQGHIKVLFVFIKMQICDFGVSKQIIKGQKLKGRCGTPAYIAPEIIKDLPYDGPMADVWSAGVVLYAMLYGNFPFRAENVEELEALIVSGQYQLPDEISNDAKRLITKILNQDPEARPSIQEILADPWMKDVNETSKN